MAPRGTDVRAKVEAGGTKAWRAVRPLLPGRAAEALRRPAKGALRRAGLFGGTGRGPATTERWPFTVEAYNGRIRLDTFAALVGAGEGRTLLDLGAGHCLFSELARDAGWTVTAVDARTDRLPEDLKGITFVQHDVRTYDVAGFDTIAVLGLLYHLTLDEQLALLRACSVARQVILETQVHDPAIVPPAAQPWGHELLTVDRLKGVVYPESKGGATADNPMASVGNATSFWMTEASLLDAFDRCGYRSVEVVQPPHFSKYGQRKFFVLHGRARG